MNEKQQQLVCISESESSWWTNVVAIIERDDVVISHIFGDGAGPGMKAVRDFPTERLAREAQRRIKTHSSASNNPWECETHRPSLVYSCPWSTGDQQQQHQRRPEIFSSSFCSCEPNNNGPHRPLTDDAHSLVQADVICDVLSVVWEIIKRLVDELHGGGGRWTAIKSSSSSCRDYCGNGPQCVWRWQAACIGWASAIFIGWSTDRTRRRYLRLFFAHFFTLCLRVIYSFLVRQIHFFLSLSLLDLCWRAAAKRDV